MAQPRQFDEHVDNATFNQILEMDEEGHDFSLPLVINFFEQADETFEKMDIAIASKDLTELSRLGHFLKGSSATLGFTKIKDNCQVIQQFGTHQNLDGTPEPNEEVCLNRVEAALTQVKADKRELQKRMNLFFGTGE